jgi:hypothetical protein
MAHPLSDETHIRPRGQKGRDTMNSGMMTFAPVVLDGNQAEAGHDEKTNSNRGSSRKENDMTATRNRRRTTMNSIVSIALLAVSLTETTGAAEAARASAGGIALPPPKVALPPLPADGSGIWRLHLEDCVNSITARGGGVSPLWIILEVDKGKVVRAAAAERLRVAVQDKEFPNEGVLPQRSLTVSIGVAEFPRDGAGRAEVLAAADQALYQAKQLGRNRVAAVGDQRSEPRRPVSFRVHVRDLDSERDRHLEGYIINVSHNGLCLLTREPVKVGDVLRLEAGEFSQGHPVLARVMWDLPRSDGFHQIGCKLIGSPEV